MDDIDINHAATDAFALIVRRAQVAGGSTADIHAALAVLGEMARAWAEDFETDPQRDAKAVAFSVATRRENRARRMG